MDLDVEQFFQHIINELKRGNRPRLKLSPEQFTTYKDYWSSALLEEPSQRKKKLIPLLGILDQAINSHPDIAALFIKTIKEEQDPELLVYLLSGAAKHIIEDSHKKGDRVSFDFLQVLEGTLQHKDGEVLEWTLRCIEQLGSQSIFFKKQVLARKPGFLQSFNKHNKTARELTAYLEKRWSPHGQ